MSDNSVATKCQKLINENLVTIFSKTTCPFCTRIKLLFKSLQITPVIVELDVEVDGSQIQQYLYELTKQRTVPNVFVQSKHVGGCDDTMKAYGNGTLQVLLKGSTLSTPKEKIEALLQEHKVVIFSKSTCHKSAKVKDIFYRLGVKPFVYAFDEEPDGEELEEVFSTKDDSKDLPQAFVEGVNIGSYDEVKESYDNGNLSKLILSDENIEEFDYDILVIGGGSGGLAAAKEAASLGKKVGLCDFVKPTPKGTTWGLGGTCVNVGCIPKKLMHQASLLGESQIDSVSFGWQFPMSQGQISWDVLVLNVQNYIKSLNFGYRKELNKRKVKYFNAYAEFKSPHRLKLTDKKGEVSEITAKDIIIAVGGRPAYPDIPGAKEYCITSDDLFALPTPPGKTLIIGASYIALECGGFLRGLGFDVTIMVRSILLRGFDRQIADLIEEHMERIGVKFVKGYEPTAVGETGEGTLKVAAKSQDGEETVVSGFNTVVLAIGRQACTSNIGLENVPNLKINPKNKKIIVDDFERSSVPHIYAIGDVIDGKPELTPVAIHAGKYLAQRLAGLHNRITNYKQVPTTVFTPLEYGCVGLSEEEAAEIFGQENLIVYHNSFKPLEHSLSREETLGYAKLICVKPLEELVVGFHILSPNAGEITQGYAIAFKLRAKKKDFDDLIGIHPTCAEVFTTLSTVKKPGDKPPETTGC